MKAFGNYLNSDELQLLQGCLDAILATNKTERDSERGEAIASSLLSAYQCGVRDRETLISLADVWDAVSCAS